MFLANSRYADVPYAVVPARGGTAMIVRIRRLPTVTGDPVVVVGNDALDIMADRRYGDPTMFWHIADANSELEAGRLVETANRAIAIPST